MVAEVERVAAVSDKFATRSQLLASRLRAWFAWGARRSDRERMGASPP